MRRVWGRLGAIVGSTLLAAGQGVVPASAADPNVAFTITDPRITELSGLTRDTDNGVYWAVNDSGDKGIVYALGEDGKVRGTLEYNTRPTDVEAVIKAGQRLYVGDIGDNQRKRDKITVYYFDNPGLGNDRSGSFRSYDFSYPDGAHDAEAMFVDQQGRLYFVTKEADGDVYAAPRELSSSGSNRLTRVAEGPSFVTDAATLPDGRFVLRSYVSVEILEQPLFSTVAQAGTPFQVQGEAVTLSLDGKSLLLGSEGARSAVLKVPVPSQLQQAPTPAATPPASPAASAAPAQEDHPVAAQPDRSGTLIALLLALVVSLLSGVVVWLRGRTRPAAAGRARIGARGPATADSAASAKSANPTSNAPDETADSTLAAGAAGSAPAAASPSTPRRADPATSEWSGDPASADGSAAEWQPQRSAGELSHPWDPAEGPADGPRPARGYEQDHFSGLYQVERPPVDEADEPTISRHSDSRPDQDH